MMMKKKRAGSGKTQQPKKTPRIPAAARRQKIVEAAMLVFANQGFHGATTRDLARAAAVSEALLFKHFKTKEDIYREVEFLCLEARQVAGEYLQDAEAGTRSLVLAVALLTYEVFRGFGGRGKNEMLRRLQTHSLLEDGRFARAFFEAHFTGYFPFIRRCFAAARKSGDLADQRIPDLSSIWFVHHLPMMVRLTRLAPNSVRYGSSEQDLLEQMTLFSLRGMGLKETAIRKHYDPRIFRTFEKAEKP